MLLSSNLDSRAVRGFGWSRWLRSDFNQGLRAVTSATTPSLEVGHFGCPWRRTARSPSSPQGLVLDRRERAVCSGAGAAKRRSRHAEGTAGYRVYVGEGHDIACAGKPVIRGSTDPHYTGAPGHHNPEDLLVTALSACHMLGYLHLCALHQVAVTAYEDAAEGLMQTHGDGSGEF